MKKSISIIILILCISIHANAQDINLIGNTLILDSEYSNSANVTATAYEWIKLNPGFQFTSLSGGEFNSECLVFEEIDPESQNGGPGGEIGALVGSDGLVGAIPGNFAVSPSGAASYTIPIECPAGINGMTPGVALSYNSQAGNGIAGYGWNIAGSSAITKMPENIYFDGYYKPIQWTGEDVFAFNGVRMFEVSSYLGETEYKLENDPRVKIIGYYDIIGGPSYFKVWTGDGKVFYYGDNLSALNSSNYGGFLEKKATKSISFNLTKVEDNFGNYIEYEYAVDSLINGDIVSLWNFRLDKISYTLNGSNPAFYNVNFEYEDRNDEIISWISEDKFRNAKRLNEISIEYNGSDIKTYSLNYDFDNYSFLESVELSVQNDEKFNKTVFQYGDEFLAYSYNIIADPLILEEERVKGILSGDFDGNGISDVCVLKKYEILEDVETYRYDILLNKLENGELITEYATTLLCNIVMGHVLTPSFPSKTIGDLNNDGKSDILTFEYVDNSVSWRPKSLEYNAYTDSWHMIDSDGLGSVSKSFIYKGPGFNGDELPYFTIAEINGDGRADLIAINKNSKDGSGLDAGKHDVHMWISSSDNTLHHDSLEIRLNGEEIEDFLVIDGNGDGLSDILCMRNDISKFAFNLGAGAGFFQDPANYSNIYHSDEILGAGEFNSDGLADLCILRSDYIYLAINENCTFDLIPTNIYLPTGYAKEEDDVLIVDYNDDGYSDIIVTDEEWDNSDNLDYSEIKTYINTGSNQVVYDPSSYNVFQDHRYRLFSNDFNGDGIVDLVDHIDTIYRIKSIEPANGKRRNICHTIYNGLGNGIDIEYSTLIKDNDIYSIDHSISSNIRPVNNSFAQVVKSIDNGLSTIDYEYENALLHLKGKGFLGFKKIITKNIILDALTESSFELNSSYYFLEPTETLTKTIINNSEIKTERYDFSTVLIDGKRYKHRLVEKSIINHLKSSKSETFYSSFDAYGNPQNSLQKFYKNNNPIAEDTISSTNIYNNITDNEKWLLGQIQNSSTTYSRPNETDITKTGDFDYYDNGALQYKYMHKDSTLEVKEEYSYDDFGNITSLTVKAENDPSIPSENRIITTTNSYSNNGRFLLSSINPLGFQSSFMYYEDLGLKMKETDVNNNLTTEYQYDEFGRLNKTISPSGLPELQSLHWVSEHEDAPTGGLTYSVSQALGVPEIITFYDKFSRELRTVSKDFHGNKVYSDKVYNTKGQLWKTSLPYIPTETAYWKEMTYDEYGRIIREDNPDGSFVSFDLDNPDFIEKTVGKGTISQKTSSYFNSLGEITSNVDNQNNVVETNYYADGQAKSYVYGSYSVDLEYDENGNRSSITDPNAGTIESSYNAWGELIESEDDNGSITKFEYDILSRPVTEEQYVMDGSTPNLVNTKTYEYDTEFIGSIESISQTDRLNSLSYDYDDYGRIERTTEVYYTNDALTESVTLQFENEYDGLGRLQKRTYPSGLELDYYYTNQGDLSFMKAQGKNLWVCNDVNSLGQIVGYSMGGRNSEINYDIYGKLTSMNYSGFKNFEIEFDDLGNVLSRNDITLGLKEEFSYDDMSRLTKVEYWENNIHQSSYDLEMEYDSEGMGNIESKTDVGSEMNYGESNSGPNAISSIYNLNGYQPNDQYIEYTAFNKVSLINEILSNEDIITLEIEYGIDDQRRQSIFTNDGDPTATRTKLFFSNYEEISGNGTTMAYEYIYSPTGLCTVYEYEKDVPPGGEETLWHVNTDYLGSLALMYDSDDITNKRECSFSAWGIERDPTDWTQEPGIDLFADRGYTGHEHLSEFALINMNGRVYDPVLARFLSPDPYVQMPGFRDGFNRYAYVLNNPLKYTDPDGEWFIPLITTLGMAYLGGLESNGFEPNPINWDWNSFSTYYSVISGGFTGYGIGHNIESKLTQRKFRNGINLISYDDGGITYNSNGGIKYSNESAEKFVDYYFDKIPNKTREALKNIYADGRSICGVVDYDVEFKHYIDLSTLDEAGGFTIHKKNGNSDMYLAETIFSDKYKLYSSIGHELIHVHHNRITHGGLHQDHLLYLTNKSSSEFWANTYVVDQNNKWSSITNHPGFKKRADFYSNVLDTYSYYNYDPLFDYNLIFGIFINSLP